MGEVPLEATSIGIHDHLSCPTQSSQQAVARIWDIAAAISVPRRGCRHSGAVDEWPRPHARPRGPSTLDQNAIFRIGRRYYMMEIEALRSAWITDKGYWKCLLKTSPLWSIAPTPAQLQDALFAVYSSWLGALLLRPWTASIVSPAHPPAYPLSPF